jgi:hypothetical protein
MLGTILLGIVGFVLGVGIHRTVKELRDRKALRGGGLTIEKKLLAATVKLNAAEQRNNEMRSYLGLNPVRREALVDDEPVANKKARAKKKASESSPSVEDLKGLGVGAGSLPMLMLMVIGTAMLAEQQKKKGQAKKPRDLKSLKARLEKKAHPAEPFSKSDMSLMKLKRRLNEKLKD